MVSLLIPRIAKLIQYRTAPEAYRLLNRHWYLTRRAQAQRERVIALIQQVMDDYPKDPQLGRELSKDIVNALGRARFLSTFAETWGMRLKRRD